MMRMFLRVALSLATGSIASALLFWAFVNTPESRALMLVLSASLVVAIVVVLALAVNVAVLAIDVPVRQVIGRALRIVPMSVLAGVLVAIGVLGVRRVDAWLAGHAGEISAWFIATLDWSDVTILFEAERYLSAWLRWVVIPVTALALVGSVLLNGIGAVWTRTWLRAAWYWRTLLLTTVTFVLLVWLPWRGVGWRPEQLPPTWVEPLFAGTRLMLIAAAMLVGATVVVTTVTRAVRNSP
jgi:hypothetical protein